MTALPQLPDKIEAALSRMEQQFSAVTTLIVAGDAPGLESASAQLRALALDLTALLDIASTSVVARTELRLRLRNLASILAAQRENLQRRLTSVERSLHALVPATQGATYASTTSPYGSSARRTGAFTHLAA